MSFENILRELRINSLALTNEKLIHELESTEEFVKENFRGLEERLIDYKVLLQRVLAESWINSSLESDIRKALAKRKKYQCPFDRTLEDHLRTCRHHN